MPPGAVTGLRAAGLLERAPNPNDRRGSLLRLLPAGDDVVADYRQRYAAMLRAVDGTHGGELHEVLNDLATSLYEQAAAAGE